MWPKKKQHWLSFPSVCFTLNEDVGEFVIEVRKKKTGEVIGRRAPYLFEGGEPNFWSEILIPLREVNFEEVEWVLKDCKTGGLIPQDKYPLVIRKPPTFDVHFLQYPTLGQYDNIIGIVILFIIALVLYYIVRLFT